jgi:hypothetical protein
MQRERERELAELERATRTVFAFNISIKADERDIFGFFSKAGQVGASWCDVWTDRFRGWDDKSMLAASSTANKVQ